MKTRDKAAYWGVGISLATNFIFWVANGKGRMGSEQYLFCIKLPIIVTVILLIFVAITVGNIRGAVPLNKWTVEDTKKLLLQKISKQTTYLARAYLILINPLYFFGTWILVAAGFYRIVNK